MCIRDSSFIDQVRGRINNSEFFIGDYRQKCTILIRDPVPARLYGLPSLCIRLGHLIPPLHTDYRNIWMIGLQLLPILVHLTHSETHVI